jgi:hypothetical protein
MAFNGVQPASGPFYLAPGSATRITIWYGDPGEDHGAQWIMAHPIDEGWDAELALSDHSKILLHAVGCIEVNGTATACPGADPYYRYAVTVTNWSTTGTHFNVQGGGNA